MGRRREQWLRVWSMDGLPGGEQVHAVCGGLVPTGVPEDRPHEARRGAPAPGRRAPGGGGRRRRPEDGVELAAASGLGPTAAPGPGREEAEQGLPPRHQLPNQLVVWRQRPRCMPSSTPMCRWSGTGIPSSAPYTRRRSPRPSFGLLSNRISGSRRSTPPGPGRAASLGKTCTRSTRASPGTSGGHRYPRCALPCRRLSEDLLHSISRRNSRASLDLARGLGCSRHQVPLPRHDLEVILLEFASLSSRLRLDLCRLGVGPSSCPGTARQALHLSKRLDQVPDHLWSVAALVRPHIHNDAPKKRKKESSCPVSLRSGKH